MGKAIDPKIREKVDAYIMANPIDATKKDPYSKAATQLGVANEYIRTRYRQLKNGGKVEGKDEDQKVESDEPAGWKEGYTNFKQVESGDADLTFVTGKRVQTKEDIIEAAQIDLKKWNVESFEVTTWEGYRKNKAVDLQWESGVSTGFVVDKGGMYLQTLYRVKIKLSPRKLDTDLGLQKEAVIEALKAYSPIVENRHTYHGNDRNCLLEICTFDLHLGSLSWGQETGDSYDIRIAEKRFKDSVRDLLSRVNLNNVERILFPIGNDLMNIDNKNNSTTNGTIVDTDVRFLKMLQVAERIMVETIDELSLIAPVDVVVIPGNHDATISLVLGEILSVFYRNNQNVTVFSSPKTRKYYQYGKVGIQLTHGDEENHQQLGMIFATEEPHMWAATFFRFSQLGHFHKNKKINYVSVDEHPGFQIQILPTLSGATAWAHKKGYHSLKQAKAFLFDRDKGMVAEYTTTA